MRNAFEARAWPKIHSFVTMWPHGRDLAPNRVTVIAVAFRSLDYLRTFLDALELRWDHRISEVIVVDNASRDGSRRVLEGAPLVRSIFLPVNIFHGPALDLATHFVQTEYFVTLDIDAFPISDEWLDVALEPLTRGFTVSGARYPLLVSQGDLAPYAHPSFLAMRTRHFRDQRHSFAAVRRNGRLIFDAGGKISSTEGASTYLIETSSIRGPGDIGAVYAGSVFHLFGGTRMRISANAEMQRLASEARDAWLEAVTRYIRHEPKNCD